MAIRQRAGKILPGLNPLSKLCLVGDINISFLAPTKSDPCDYLNVLSKLQIECIIEAPTREEFYGGKFIASCIDQVNIRASNATFMSAMVAQNLADHYFVGCAAKSQVGR